MPSLIEDQEAVPCANCGAEHPDEDSALQCCPTWECERCGETHYDPDDAERCCMFECHSCGALHRYEDEAYECCRYCCPDCGSSYEYEEDAMDCCRSSNYWSGPLPSLPEISDLDEIAVKVPAIPGRPARLCSLEQELADGGAIVARILYDAGLSESSEVLDYHSGSSSPGYARVEEDGSLPDRGGEVVYDRFNLAVNYDAKRLGLALTKIRQLRDHQSSPRLVATSYAAGIHVHLSARDADGKTMTPGNMAALYELWCYAEDMLYAFSAAGWQRHRQRSDSQSGYCKAVPKVEGTASPAKVWRAMRSDRYFGLNFQRLYAALNRCSCGATATGDWDACECGAFDGATVEWRVFNSSTLPRTIHAWLLMAHAMMAYAAKHEVGTLAENPYGSQTPAERRRVLRHLLRILPLTDGEKEIIQETADRSPGL